jgi:hypothetical protein
MGRNVIHCGESGAGQAAKLCNNMLLAISMIGTCEAFTLAEKLGLSHEALFEVASKSSGQCWSLSTYCPVPGPVPGSPANRGYTPGFATALMLKDLACRSRRRAHPAPSTPLGARRWPSTSASAPREAPRATFRHHRDAAKGIADAVRQRHPRHVQRERDGGVVAAQPEQLGHPRSPNSRFAASKLASDTSPSRCSSVAKPCTAASSSAMPSGTWPSRMASAISGSSPPPSPAVMREPLVARLPARRRHQDRQLGQPGRQARFPAQEAAGALNASPSPGCAARRGTGPRSPPRAPAPIGGRHLALARRHRGLGEFGEAGHGVSFPGLAGSVRADSGRPQMPARNVLFIMCDQLRWDHLACAGHPHIRTPNLDALAARGTRFTQAYVQSGICGPSRMSFYTGRYVASHGATHNRVPLSLGEVTLGWHLRNPAAPWRSPARRTCCPMRTAWRASPWTARTSWRPLPARRLVHPRGPP